MILYNRLGLFLWVQCAFMTTTSVFAWTLADRLSGRFDPPRRSSSYSLRARRRTKRFIQDHLTAEGGNNGNNKKNKLCNNRCSFTALHSSISNFNNKSSNNNNNKTGGLRSSTKKDQLDMIDFIRQPMDTLVGDYPYNNNKNSNDGTAVASNNNNNNNLHNIPDDLLDLVYCIVKAADGRKAEDIVAMQVSHITTLTQVLVLLSGNSRPQNQAIAAAITRDVGDEFGGLKPGGNGVPEGSAESGWMLLDYGSVMVHIMTPKSRLYYNVEGQWQKKGGKYMDISDILVPNTPPPIQQQQATIAETATQTEGQTAVTSTSQAQDYKSEEDDPFWS